MGIYFWEGQPLFVNGALAMHEDCCCGDEEGDCVRYNTCELGAPHKHKNTKYNTVESDHIGGWVFAGKLPPIALKVGVSGIGGHNGTLYVWGTKGSSGLEYDPENGYIASTMNGSTWDIGPAPPNFTPHSSTGWHKSTQVQTVQVAYHSGLGLTALVLITNYYSDSWSQSAYSQYSAWTYNGSTWEDTEEEITGMRQIMSQSSGYPGYNTPHSAFIANGYMYYSTGAQHWQGGICGQTAGILGAGTTPWALNHFSYQQWNPDTQQFDTILVPAWGFSVYGTTHLHLNTACAGVPGDPYLRHATVGHNTLDDTTAFFPAGAGPYTFDSNTIRAGGNGGWKWWGNAEFVPIAPAPCHWGASHSGYSEGFGIFGSLVYKYVATTPKLILAAAQDTDPYTWRGVEWSGPELTDDQANGRLE